MYKLLRNLTLLGIMVLIISIGLLNLSYHADHYMLAGRDKYARLRSTKAPRLILIGGSNVAFSIDSTKLEARLGMPVINMGLTAGLGLKFMLLEVEALLHNGDIVLIMPEYEQFSALPLGGRSIDLGSAAKYCPECFLTTNVIYEPEQIGLATAGLFQGIEGDLFAKITAQDEVYKRQGFDQHGDMVAHLAEEDQRDVLNHIMPELSPDTADVVNFLNSFQRDNSAKGTVFFLMYPGIPEREYRQQKATINALHAFLEENLEIPILGTPKDFVYPPDHFFDTVYHMNKMGREQRTNRIIELLQTR